MTLDKKLKSILSKALLAGTLAVSTIAIAKPRDIYILKSGDTYSSIAKTEIESFPEVYAQKSIYALSNELEDFNGTPAEKLQIGQRIRIPELVSEQSSENYKSSNTNSESFQHSKEDNLLLTKVLYAESANQTKEAKTEVAKLINSRIHSGDYPNTLEDVIFQKNAFECVNGKLWKDVENKNLNGYELKVLFECYDVAKNVLSNDLQTENVAYHDISIKKPNDSYWNGLTETKQLGRLKFYSKNE